MTNEELARELKDLGDLLVIGGYEESHATRYAKLAYQIPRLPESVEQMHREGRLRELPGVGETVAQIIAEYLTTGTCAKRQEWEREHAPTSVLELVSIPGLGAKTARRLYAERGIASLAAFAEALDTGALDDFKGLGPKLRQAVRERAST